MTTKPEAKMVQQQHLVSSADTIKSLQQEVLRLKLLLHNQQQNQPPNLDETKRDLIAELMEANTKLREELEALKEEQGAKPSFRDAECQTAIDGYNIDQLFMANLTLKRQKRSQEQQHHQQQQQQQQQKHLQEQQHQQLFQRHQQQQQQLSKSRPPTSTVPMLGDEKESLEKLFRIDGLMTTIRDKLMTKLETN